MHGACVPRYRKQILAPATSICQLRGRPGEALMSSSLNSLKWGLLGDYTGDYI